ncbi:unnamed protein product, partial [Adineta ricciae]
AWYKRTKRDGNETFDASRRSSGTRVDAFTERVYTRLLIETRANASDRTVKH